MQHQINPVNPLAFTGHSDFSRCGLWPSGSVTDSTVLGRLLGGGDGEESGGSDPRCPDPSPQRGTVLGICYQLLPPSRTGKPGFEPSLHALQAV